MKLNKFQIQQIKKDFYNLKDTYDLVILLNKVNTFIYKDKKVKFKYKELYFHAFYDKKKYRKFSIKKNTGGERIIHVPNNNLNLILKSLNIVLQCVYYPHESTHGFIWKKSIVTNAKNHISKNFVFNIDLVDFFHSIHQPRVWKKLQLPPFNLNNERIKLANIIANLCCHVTGNDNIGTLPQGAPTSPVISNIICERLDRRLNGIAKKHNVTYTRYADDITFSSMHNVYHFNSTFITEINEIIKSQNFKINIKKTRLQKAGFRQEVTGIIVNTKTNVNIKFIKKTRTLIHLIEKYGLEKAQSIFSKYYKYERPSHLHYKSVPNIESVIKGKLDFIKMVKGNEDSTFLSLKNKYASILILERENNISKN